MDGYNALKNLCEVLHWNQLRIAELEQDKQHLLETLHRRNAELEIAKQPIDFALFCEMYAALDDLTRNPNNLQYPDLLKRVKAAYEGNKDAKVEAPHA